MSESRCKSLKPGDVRAQMPARVHQRSTTTALLLFALGMALYLGALVGTVVAPWWPLKLLLSLTTAFFLSICFVIGHDACHGAFTSSARLNAILGRIALLPSWHPYASWEHSHNHIHHAWTNLYPKDTTWSPYSKDRYDQLPAWRRAMVRYYRTPTGMWAYALFGEYLPKILFPSRAFRGRMKMRRFVADCLLVLAFAVAQTVFLIVAPRWLGGGSSVVESLYFGQWLPMLVWLYLVGFLTFLHHTHPLIPWFDDLQEWTFYKGQIRGTAHVSFPGPINWVIHGIMEHTAHHADPRVPLYRLAEAQESLAQAFPDDIIEHKFGWHSFSYTLRTCRLYDFRNHRWLDWNGEPTSSRTIAAPVAAPVEPAVKVPVEEPEMAH